MKVLQRNLTQVNQGWELGACYEVEGAKLRVRIRRDAYDFQSYAVVEVWSKVEQKWNNVTLLPTNEMASMRASYVRPLSEEDREAFAEDEWLLLSLAQEVIA